MEKSKEYIEKNKSRFLGELFQLLRIESISAQSEHRGDMFSAAKQLQESLLAAGADRAEVMRTAGNPIVFAEKLIDPAKPTVVVYGHYDVMPIDPVDEWQTAPFEPIVKEGRIWCRGADDDKGQLFMHVKAFETLVATGTLPCNVKFMLEGEEEIGSSNLYEWCRENRELVQGDVILISDTSMISMETPSITCGLRGICYMQIEVKGPDHDLHSGLYGGAVTNPANALAEIIAKLKKPDGSVAIPHFYDDVRVLSDQERTAFNSAPFSQEAYMKSIGVDALAGEKGYTTIERTGIRPALDVNGIWGGYTDEGTKTIIPSHASAKVSMRLVPDQNWEHIAELFTAYVRKIAPAGVTVEVKKLHGGQPYVSPTDLKAYKAAEQAVTDTFGRAPLPFYSGGSIPIVSGFESILGMKSILLGFGLSRDAIHSPNESYGLENFYRGIETIVRFYRRFTE